VLLWLIPGFALPTLSGWLLLSLLEGRTPVLYRNERFVLGFLFGLTLTMFLSFLTHIIGLIGFTFAGFAAVQLALVLSLGGLFLWKRDRSPLPSVARSAKEGPLPDWARVAAWVLGSWVTLKLLAGAIILTATPIYQDDVFSNWNMRGKLFFETERLTLTMPLGNDAFTNEGVSSYPPTVPMVKTWLATLAGTWSDSLVNAPHLLWYLTLLALVFFALRRHTTKSDALLGTYLLASLPLPLIHGITPYADVFLAAHLFAAVSLLFTAFTREEPRERQTFFRLGAVASALLIFTKNETLLLHLPILLLILGGGIVWLRRNGKLSNTDVIATLLWYGGTTALVALPWIAFKIAHDLPFGNAKAITGLSIAWQPDVAWAIWYNTFFEGNWNLFPPLLIGLLALRFRRAFAPPFLVLTAFLLLVYAAQLPLYFLTGLSIEATNQTGYARGLVHLMPIAVLLVTLLLRDTLTQCLAMQPSSDTNLRSASPN
jgi:hypothetical protein